MRESMLLQATDDLLRGELRGLRAQLGRLAGRPERPCAPATPAEARLAPALDELLQASRDAGRRLARLEGAGAQRLEQAGGALGAVLEELRRTREDLRAVQGWAARRWLPAGEHPGREGTSPRLCSGSARGGEPSPAILQANTLGRTTPSSPSPSPFSPGLRHAIHGREISLKKYSPVPGNPGDSCGRGHHSLETGKGPLLTPDPPGPAGGATGQLQPWPRQRFRFPALPFPPLGISTSSNFSPPPSLGELWFPALIPGAQIMLRDVFQSLDRPLLPARSEPET